MSLLRVAVTQRSDFSGRRVRMSVFKRKLHTINISIVLVVPSVDRTTLKGIYAGSPFE
jgi:hypothetical protein